jgi:hypothetical protein
MKSRVVAAMALIAFFVVLLSANAAAVADQDKDAELREKIEQLEKRIAELEKQIKELRAAAKAAPRTSLEDKLVGTWMVVDDDKKHAWLLDMKLNGDGTCSVAHYSMGAKLNATYQVIGKQVVISLPKGATSAALGDFRIVALTETELVIERKNDGDRKTRYTRAK